MPVERTRPTESQSYSEQLLNLEISAETLSNDNHTQRAEEIIAKFNEGKKRSDLTLVSRCSDARLKSIGEHAISIGSVAAGLTASERILTNNSIPRSVVLTHLDGEKIVPGEVPSGCGGLEAKDHIESVEGTEIEPHINGYIANKDPLVQSVRVAEQIAGISGKPSAAWVIDHRTDNIYPIAFFQYSGDALTRVSKILESDVHSKNFEKIYQDGIPTIDEDLFPQKFQELLEQNRREQEQIRSRFPDLKEIQRIQNPRAVLFSTDIRSAKKFPELASIPGSVFKVFANREKLGDLEDITQENMEMTFRQLWYAITHANKNDGDPEKPFMNTDRFIIETPSMELSEKVAEKALKKPWIRTWMEKPDRKIILLRTNAGHVNDASEINS